jgi:hypothetical protein
MNLGEYLDQIAVNNILCIFEVHVGIYKYIHTCIRFSSKADK